MKEINTVEYIESVAEMLHDGVTKVPLPVTGCSMAPFLIEGDTAYISLTGGNLRTGDIVLYLRAGKRYVLHRIIKGSNGIYSVAGDAQSEIEEGITDDMIIGKAVSAVRRGKECTPKSFVWKFYSSLWVRLVGLRKPILKAYNFIKYGKK